MLKEFFNGKRNATPASFDQHRILIGRSVPFFDRDAIRIQVNKTLIRGGGNGGLSYVRGICFMPPVIVIDENDTSL